jgi:hypothetical protein
MDAHKPKRAKDVLARAHSSAFCPLVNSLTTPALSTSLLPLVLTTKPTNDFTSLPIEVESSQRVPLPSTAQLGLGMGRFGARHSDRRCTVPPVPAEHDKVGRWTASPNSTSSKPNPRKASGKSRMPARLRFHHRWSGSRTLSSEEEETTAFALARFRQPLKDRPAGAGQARYREDMAPDHPRPHFVSIGSSYSGFSPVRTLHLSPLLFVLHAARLG